MSATAAERCDALRALATLLRTGLPPAAAVGLWRADVTPALRPAVERAGRRLELGADLRHALAGLEDAFGAHAAALADLLDVALVAGGDAARMVDGLAHSVERDAELDALARSAAAGAKLSARVVAGLPFLLMPAAPIAGAPVADVAGLTLLCGGLVLAGAGLAWIERLLPRPPGRDGGAVLAEIAASALRAGIAAEAAFEALARRPPVVVADGLGRARRLVALGAPWIEALRRSGDEGLAVVGAAMRHALAHGLPVANALEACARRRDELARFAFETALRRAPVLMVVPLTVCVLPAYLLLGLGPFLRGLTLG